MEINSSNFDLILGHRILFYFFFLENSGRHFSVFWAPIMDGSRALDSFRLSRPIKFESRKPPKNKTNLDPRTATPLGNLITFSFFFLKPIKIWRKNSSQFRRPVTGRVCSRRYITPTQSTAAVQFIPTLSSSATTGRWFNSFQLTRRHTSPPGGTWWDGTFRKVEELVRSERSGRCAPIRSRAPRQRPWAGNAICGTGPGCSYCRCWRVRIPFFFFFFFFFCVRLWSCSQQNDLRWYQHHRVPLFVLFYHFASFHPLRATTCQRFVQSILKS